MRIQLSFTKSNYKKIHSLANVIYKSKRLNLPSTKVIARVELCRVARKMGGTEYIDLLIRKNIKLPLWYPLLTISASKGLQLFKNNICKKRLYEDNKFAALFAFPFSFYFSFSIHPHIFMVNYYIWSYFICLDDYSQPCQ